MIERKKTLQRLMAQQIQIDKSRGRNVCLLFPKDHCAKI